VFVIRRIGDENYRYALYERVLDLAQGGTTLAKIRELTTVEAAQLIRDEQASDQTGDFF
jgi:hypothetical protein